MKFSVVGDIMLGDQPVRSGFGIYSLLRGRYKSAFGPLIESSAPLAFSVGNFEGVLVRHVSRLGPDESAMKVPAQAAEILAEAKILYLSIANNHSMHYGPDYFHEMCDLFRIHGITVFGLKTSPFAIITCHSHRIGLLGFSTIPAFHGFEPEYLFVKHDCQDSIDNLIRYLHDAKQRCDYLIVYPHWGFEFIPSPCRYQLMLAQRLIEAGADLIAGTHPHVVQSPCYIAQRPVIFSLGNLFSDYWQLRIRESLSVIVELDDIAAVSLHKLLMDESFVVRSTGQIVPIESNPPISIDDQKYAIVANQERARVRKEVLLFLLRNVWHVAFNVGLIRWILRRAAFLFKSRNLIKKNPSDVYS